EALAAWYLLRRAGFRPSLERLRDVVAFTALAGLAATALAATNGVTALWLAVRLGLGAVVAWRRDRGAARRAGPPRLGGRRPPAAVAAALPRGGCPRERARRRQRGGLPRRPLALPLP